MQLNLLRGEIASHNMTANMLATTIGMKPKTLYNKLNGNSAFTVDEANKICEALQIEDVNKRVAIFLS